MDGYQLRAIVSSKTRSSPAAKQRAGQAYAKKLGLVLGKSGADGGVDGYGVFKDCFIYFQCKLSHNPLGAEYADEFYSGLERHADEEKYAAHIGIMLAGVGYIERGDAGFLARLKSHPRIRQGIFTCHLLSLEDIYTQSEKFLLACEDLPQLGEICDDDEFWE
ncbi:restriction endonuclease [bacterium]|nr:restriction endonuclease [bacterium]